MALVLKDRVKETSTTVGTGTLTLAGAVSGFQSFAAIGNGNTTYYAISDPAAGTWEVGIGTYTSSGTTLSRDTVLSSSSGGSLVSFGAGSKDVFVTYPSSRAVYTNSAGTYTTPSAFDTLTANNATLAAGTIAAIPASGTDIANKAYVDTTATGLTIHTPVVVVSTSNLNATYVDGGTTPTWTTITNTSELATGSAHGLSAGAVIVFANVSTSGLTAGTAYFVNSTPTATSITLSLIKDGPTITTLVNGGGYSITSRVNSGVGATLTNAGTKAALTINGVTLTTTQRVLVQGQTSAFQNGVYTVTTVGTPDPGGTNWVLTRATDANTYDPRSNSALGEGDYFFVTSGDTGKGDSFVLATSGTIVFGTTNLTFSQFSESAIYSAGTGLTLSSLVFSITPVGSASTYGSASQVPVFTTNSTGQITAVTNTNIAINGSAVTGNITGQAGSVANALTAGTYLTGGSYNGSTAVTFTVDATAVNTASKVVARDSSGNFAAGTITASLSGNATTATTATNLAGGVANQIPYQTSAGTTAFATAPSASNQVLNWNGSAFTWSAGTISGVALGSNLNSLTAGTYLTGTAYNGSAAQTWSVDATNANTASKVVARDASGNFSAGTITAALSGNATSATNLAGGGAGQIPYNTGLAATAFLAAGTAGQLLQSNGASAPSWVAPSSGISAGKSIAFSMVFGF